MPTPKLLRKTMFPLIGLFGYRISSLSNLKDVQDFMRTLHPIEFNLIRIGSMNDGGYLVPDDLDSISACFSPGVSNNSDFETDLAFRGIPSFLADFSVEAPPVYNERFTFLKKFVGPTNEFNCISFNDWVESNSEANGDLILQMDIEGSEYGTLLSCDRKNLRRFRILIIEFHGLDLLFDKQGFEIVRDCFRKILEDFYVVHIHPNNNDPLRSIKGCEIPSLMEFSFIRKDRVNSLKFVTKFPHTSDRASVPLKKDFVLPSNFYRIG
jgi:hypothetical protein